MWPADDLAQLEKDVHADSAQLRNKAMLELRERVRKRPKLGPRLLPIFREAVERPLDGWTTALAICGIEEICGAEEGRRLRVPLFDHPDPEMACPAILCAPDAECVPAMIATMGRLLERAAQQPEASGGSATATDAADTKVRIAILQTFGRLRDRAAMEVMVSCLGLLEERPHAIEALGNLGDPRAIPYLEQWHTDPTPTWPLDDRGGEMMTVGDMVGYAIGKIGFHTRGSLATPPPIPVTPISATPVPATPSVMSLPALPVASAASAFTSAAPVLGASASSSMWGKLLTFVPLAAALFLIPLIFVLVIFSLDSQGHVNKSPAQTHLFDILCLIPVLIGLAAGLWVILAYRPLFIWQWIVLGVGCAACAVAAFSFGWELFH